MDEDTVHLSATPGEARTFPPTVAVAGDPRGKKATWKLIPVDTSDGHCSQCARLHEPEMPHDQRSLAYQYAFYAEHDRWPTWKDAMAHCTPEVQEAWTQALQAQGIEVED